MRRLLAAAALALSLGCVDSGTGNALAPIWVPSSYRLEAIDGEPLPVSLTTLEGETHTIESDSLQLLANYTFYHERQVLHPLGTQTLIDDGPFGVTREGRVVIAEAGQMLTGTGSPSGGAIADVLEFITTSEAAYGEHRFRFVRTAP